MADQRAQRILSQVNQRIPAGVDWKAGALTYLDQLFTGDNREQMRRFHLVKPFTTFQDATSSIRLQAPELSRELSFFAHILSVLDLPVGSSFLDVACGTGWVSHYLAKLGLRVCGFDISPAMIDLARERIAADPWPTTTGKPLNIDFLVHDIEEAPLAHSEKFDVAILESALHHFVDPIQTLKNIRHNLSDDGLVIIIEGSSDGEDKYCREIMERYNTLERPYTTSELEEIVACAGFPAQRRMIPLSGFFHPGVISLRAVESLLCEDWSWNTLIAGQSVNSLKAVCLQGAVEPANNLVDASGEVVVNLECENWISASSRLRISMPDSDGAELIFRTPVPNITGQAIHLVVIDKHRNDKSYVFHLGPCSQGDAELRLSLPLSNGLGDFELKASQIFSPTWLQQGVDDARLLSGRIQVLPSSALSHDVVQSAGAKFVAINDCWMGPNAEFVPMVNQDGKVRLSFASPLPRKRLRSQHIWITVNSTGEIYKVILKPRLRSLESKAAIELSGLAAGATLTLQSSDSFKPSCDVDGDRRLISYRLTQQSIS